MAQTYLSNHVHIVFSTKDRQPLIKGERGKRLHAYLIGIAKNVGITIIAIGGMPNHIHLLVTLPGDISVAKAVNVLKSNSSKWMNEHKRDFAWQRGYGAFSVSASNVESVKAYILNQTEHHKTRDFQQEFLALLKKHHVSYDPRYVWG
ncbi:MAG TPA: IS200/IS605 family transposase [Terriglobales bacterium]|nr:IS200/IS605 family transposase [Terriglobales bacterium]